jgi:hypothetical protein
VKINAWAAQKADRFMSKSHEREREREREREGERESERETLRV